MDTRSAQLVFHFYIEELAVSREATLRNCCVTRPDPFGIPGPLGPSAHDCSGLPRFCPLVSGERLSPSSAFRQANGQCPGAAPASVKEPCEPGFRSGPPPPRPVSRRPTAHPPSGNCKYYTLSAARRATAPRAERVGREGKSSWRNKVEVESGMSTSMLHLPLSPPTLKMELGVNVDVLVFFSVPPAASPEC